MRRLEEKKKLAEEESILRQKSLKAEAEMKAQEQSIRRESLERKRKIMRELSQASRVGSEDSYSEKIVCWLKTGPGSTDEKMSPREECLQPRSI